MDKKIMKSFLKTSTAYLLFSQFEEANKDYFNHKESLLFNNMKNRLLANMEEIKNCKDNESIDVLQLELLDSYAEAVLQKIKFHLE